MERLPLLQHASFMYKIQEPASRSATKFCKICWILLSQNIWNKLLVTGDKKIYQCHISKGNDVTTTNGEMSWGLVFTAQTVAPL